MTFYTSGNTFQSCHHVGFSDKTNNFEMLLNRDRKEAIHPFAIQRSIYDTLCAAVN
jgi:hypothetical protein